MNAYSKRQLLFGLGGLTILFLLLFATCILLAIWGGDGRWGNTSLLFGGGAFLSGMATMVLWVEG